MIRTMFFSGKDTSMLCRALPNPRSSNSRPAAMRAVSLRAFRAVRTLAFKIDRKWI
jgi:hypothetical protein